MEKHPFFMTKLPEEGEELPPMVEGLIFKNKLFSLFEANLIYNTLALQQLKWDGDDSPAGNALYFSIYYLFFILTTKF
jgi:hypothetical protein